MSIVTSIIFAPVWRELEPYLVVDVYDRDGGHENPRIRIGFADLPDRLGRRLQMFEMPCVTCQRPIHPLRRRKGDGFDRLYYAPTCALTTRVECSRSRAAELEYERFKGIKDGGTRQTSQLQLFYDRR